MARVFSGIKPTGEMHLGNYLGAVRRWVDGQPAAGSAAARDHDAIFCVVDLHAMTVPWDPAELTADTRHLATHARWRPASTEIDRCCSCRATCAAHAELTWVLNCVATFGELRRMTQFKDKSAKQGEGESVSVGFFDYPVLMVSDILLYDTAEVPVGDDQRQHVELARDVAIRFNSRFGDTFVVPKATFPAVGARVMDLQHPERKMSKSEDSPQGTILVLDPPKTIEKKIKSAVTDSGAEVRHDRDDQARRLEPHRDLRRGHRSTIADVEREFDGAQYGAFKVAVADAVVEFLRPVQERYAGARGRSRRDRPAPRGSAPTPPKRSPNRCSPARRAPRACSPAPDGARYGAFQGAGLDEIGRAAELGRLHAEVLARVEQPAHRRAARRALDDDGLRAAPLDVDADADADGGEVGSLICGYACVFVYCAL